MVRSKSQKAETTASSLQEQICARFRALIGEARMSPGSRAPSLRALAVELGVARGTVEAAYDRLIGEGWLVARGTAGTFVATSVPVRPVGGEAPALAASQTMWSGTTATEALGEGGALSLPLQLGLPALDEFPRKVWVRLVAHHARRLDSFIKPDVRGLPRLREALSVYLHRSRGVEAQARQLFIVSGYEAGLALVADALLLRGGSAVVEEPGYPPTSAVFRRLNVDPVPVAVDGNGLSVDELGRVANGAAIAVVTPSHQSPTGASMSLERRGALLDWASTTGSWIVEDDYDGEYRYQGHPLPALKSLDSNDRVIYAGTLSKVLYPGLRLGYLVVPASLVDTFERAVQLSVNGGCPSLMQEVVADFIEQGHFARHIKRMRALYARRRNWLLDALEPYASTGLLSAGNLGGMHLMISLPPGLDDSACARQARAQGLAVHALSSWCQRPAKEPALLASFTNLASPEAAVEAVARLVVAIGIGPSVGTVAVQ